jgi:hypothetical protein
MLTPLILPRSRYFGAPRFRLLLMRRSPLIAPFAPCGLTFRATVFTFAPAVLPFALLILHVRAYGAFYTFAPTGATFAPACSPLLCPHVRTY